MGGIFQINKRDYRSISKIITFNQLEIKKGILEKKMTKLQGNEE